MAYVFLPHDSSSQCRIKEIQKHRNTEITEIQKYRNLPEAHCRHVQSSSSVVHFQWKPPLQCKAGGSSGGCNCGLGDPNECVLKISTNGH